MVNVNALRGGRLAWLSIALPVLSCLSLVIAPLTVWAGERKVVVARPHLAPGVTSEHDKAIRDGIFRGLTASNAYAVGEGDIGDDLKKAGVTSLNSKAVSLKVAKAIGAYAVLRYQAKLVGDKIKVRVALFTTQSASQAFLDRVVAVDAVGGVTEEMTRGLMSMKAEVAGDGASGPSGGAGASGPSGASGASGASGGSSDDVSPPSPLMQRLFHTPNPYAASGFVIEAHIAGSAPGGENASNVLSIGLQTGVNLGWQIGLGHFQSITPQFVFAYSRWGIQDNVVVNTPNGLIPVKGASNMIDLLVGARYTLHLARFSVWTGLSLGVGWLQQSLESVNDPTDTVDDDSIGFGLQWELGGHYMVSRHFGAGFFIDVMKSFVGAVNGTDYGALGFGFGLSLRTVL